MTAMGHYMEKSSMNIFLCVSLEERNNLNQERVDYKRIFSFGWTYPFGSFQNEMHKCERVLA